jgi:hypothetical protein
VEPGNHLLWAHGENVDYMTADLKAGGIYVVIVNVYFGKLGFTPVTSKDGDLFNQCKTMIKGKAPIVTPEKVYVKKQKKLAKLIPERLRLWNEKYKNDPEKHFKHISADMTTSPEEMK